MKQIGAQTWQRSFSGHGAAKALLNPCFISAELAVKPVRISELQVNILYTYKLGKVAYYDQWNHIYAQEDHVRNY